MNNKFLNSIGFKKLLVKLKKILQDLKGEIDNKLPLTGGNINGELTFIDKIKMVARPDGNSIAFGNKPFNDLVYGEFKGIKLWGNDSNDKVVLAGGGVKPLSDFSFTKTGFLKSELNIFNYRESGAYHVNHGGGTGIFVVFKAGGSTSSLELYKPNWYPGTRIGVRNTVDGNRFNDDNGDFRELAWFSDVYKAGEAIQGDWAPNKTYQNDTIFVEASGTVELNQIEHLGSISFRKVFDGGNISFTCTGKTIIYTGDTALNGDDGSTAVVSIWNQKCYIDIRNI